MAFLDRFFKPKTPPPSITRTAKSCPIKKVFSDGSADIHRLPITEDLYRCEVCGFYFPDVSFPDFHEVREWAAKGGGVHKPDWLTCRVCRYAEDFTAAEHAAVTANVARGHDVFPMVCTRHDTGPFLWCDFCSRSYHSRDYYNGSGEDYVTAVEKPGSGFVHTELCPLCNCAALVRRCASCNTLKKCTDFPRDGDGRTPNCTDCSASPEVREAHDRAQREYEQQQAAERENDPAAGYRRAVEAAARAFAENEPAKRAAEQRAQPVTLGTGDNNQPVTLAPDVRNRHTYIIGKTGSGKSSLLRNLIMQDMIAGRGLIYLDPHGDTAQTLLGYVPSDRLDDVVYFCPADLDCPAFNLLATDYAPDKLTRDMVSAIKMFFGDSWGPRLQQLLTAAVLTLLLDRVNEPHTLADLERLLIERDYRDAIAARSPHPKLNAFWLQQFPTMAKDAVHPVLNKLSDLLMPMSPMERIFSAPGNSLDLAAIMNGGKILLVNLSKGELGEAGAFLIGGLIVTAVAQAALARVRIPEAERVDCFLYVDEFQNFIIDSFQSILSEARKYRLNLTLAHQYLHQVPSNLQAAIFGNVATVVCLPISADDAGTMQREMTNTPEAPTLLDDVLNVLNTPAKQHPGWTAPQQGRDWPTRQDFLMLPPLSGFVKINTPDNVQRFTISHPTTRPSDDTRAAVLEQQRQRHQLEKTAALEAEEKNRPHQSPQETRSPTGTTQPSNQNSTTFPETPATTPTDDTDDFLT